LNICLRGKEGDPAEIAGSKSSKDEYEYNE